MANTVCRVTSMLNTVFHPPQMPNTQLPNTVLHAPQMPNTQLLNTVFEEPLMSNTFDPSLHVPNTWEVQSKAPHNRVPNK